MKNFSALVIAIMLIASLCACGNAAEDTAAAPKTDASTEAPSSEQASASAPTEAPTAGIVNPMVSAADIAELNSTIGCKLTNVEGAKDEKYFVINGEIAEYTFTVNGAEFLLRAAKQAGDISGVYDTEGNTLGMNYFDGTDVEPEAGFNGGYWARWFEGDMQYCIYSGDASASDFNMVYNSVSGRVSTLPENDVEVLAGDGDGDTALSEDIIPTPAEEIIGQ